MMKAICLAAFLIFGSSSVYASSSHVCQGSNNCNTEEQNVNNNAEGGNASSHSGSSSRSISGSQSVSTGVGVAVSGGSTSAGGEASANNSGDTTVNTQVDGDDHVTKVYSYGHSSAPAAVGTDSISVGTIFGGIGFSQTSVYTKTDNLITRLVQAHEAGVITDAEFIESYRKAIKRLENTSKRNDRGLLNMFGLF